MHGFPRISKDFLGNFEKHDFHSKMKVAKSIHGCFSSVQGMRTWPETTPRHPGTHQLASHAAVGEGEYHECHQNSLKSMKTNDFAGFSKISENHDCSRNIGHCTHLPVTHPRVSCQLNPLRGSGSRFRPRTHALDTLKTSLSRFGNFHF